MDPLVPNRFLFRFEFPIYRCARPPAIDGNLSKWNAAHRLPALHEIDEQKGFAELFASWGEDGIYLGCKVRGKQRAVSCNPKQFWKADNIRVMTDMRDTRNVRRATRFCQHFYLLPTGGRGKHPVAGGAAVNRATEDAPIAKPGDIPIASRITKSGYSLTAHFPARVLNGFDPSVNDRIGFFVIVEDGELGQQSLTVDDDLNWWIDPSTWPTAVLTRKTAAINA